MVIVIKLKYLVVLHALLHLNGAVPGHWKNETSKSRTWSMELVPGIWMNATCKSRTCKTCNLSLLDILLYFLFKLYSYTYNQTTKINIIKYWRYSSCIKWWYNHKLLYKLIWHKFIGWMKIHNNKNRSCGIRDI